MKPSRISKAQNNSGLSPIVLSPIVLLPIVAIVVNKLLVLAGLSLAIGCSSQQYDPNHWHQIYVDRLQKKIGKNFSSMRNLNGFAPDQNLLSETDTTSGHIIYKYRYIRTCRYMLEVDPKMDIIVGVDWEGEKGDCIHVP